MKKLNQSTTWRPNWEFVKCVCYHYAHHFSLIVNSSPHNAVTGRALIARQLCSCSFLQSCLVVLTVEWVPTRLIWMVAFLFRTVLLAMVTDYLDYKYFCCCFFDNLTARTVRGVISYPFNRTEPVTRERTEPSTRLLDWASGESKVTICTWGVLFEFFSGLYSS